MCVKLLFSMIYTGEEEELLNLVVFSVYLSSPRTAPSSLQNHDPGMHFNEDSR